MPVSDHEKLGVDLHARPFSDSLAGVPIKKRRVIVARSPSPPPQIPSPPPPRDCDLPEKKPFSLEGEAPFSETGGHAQVTAMTGKGGSCESRGEPINKDFDVAPKHEILSEFNHQGTIAGEGTSNMKEMILGNKCALWPVTGSTQLLSAVKEPLEAPIKEGLDGKYAPDKGIFVNQEKLEQQNLESKSSDANTEVESAHLWSNRSNWDLNTTMDKWECSLSDSAMNHGTGGHDRLGFGGIHNKRLASGSTQMLSREPKGTDETAAKCKLQKFDDHLKMSNLPNPTVEGYNSEACLDLQLKPSFASSSCFQSGKFDSLIDMSFLSLSMKPIRTSFNPRLAAGIPVKPAPNVGSQKNSRKVEMGSLKLDLKHVKSEPCDGQEASKTTGSGDMKTAIDRAVKSEHLDDQSQVHLRSLERDFPTEQKSHSLTPQSTEMEQDVGKHDSKASDVVSTSLVLDVNMQYRVAEVPNTNTATDSSEVVGEALNLATRDDNMPISTAISQNGKLIVHKLSDLASYSLISLGNEMKSIKEACETDNLSSVLLPESLVSDGKEMVAEGMTKVVAQIDCSDGYNSSEVTSIYELPINPYGNIEVAESAVGKGKVDASTENLEKPRDTGCKSDISNVAVGAIGTLRKLCGNADDYEDGELRNPTLTGAVEGSSEETEGNQVKEADSISPIDVPTAVPSHVDVKESKTGNSEELKDQGTVHGGPCDNMDEDNPSSSAVTTLTADSDKRRPSKTVIKTPRGHLKKDRGPERERKSGSDLTVETITKGNQGDVGSQKANAGGSDVLLDKVSVSSKTESAADNGTKNANCKGNHRRIVYLNAPNRLTFGKMKSTLGNSMSSRLERDRSTNKPFRPARSLSRSSRDENINERPRKAEIERSQGHPGWERGSDSMRVRSRADDRFNSFHGDRNSDPDHLSEQMNNSNEVHRFPRPINASEVAVTDASDGSGKVARKPINDELQDVPRMPCRRRSPRGRGQMPMIRHPIRDISPSRYIGGDVPDFVLLAHEEKLMRPSPDGMMDPSLLAHARSQFEREREGILVRRERRSLSPVQRRGPPLDLPHIGSKSFTRYQQRSPHQWPPPRRSPDGFNGSPLELIRCRSPPNIRLDRMRSPHQHPCFPEDMMVRRRGSPAFIAHLPNDDVDISPPREHGFPRPVRVPTRNMRRFDMIDPQEMAEDEYFEPPLQHGQIREFAVDDEFVEDRRRSDERHGPVRSFRQHDIAGDNDGEGFRFYVEDGPPRPHRFCPETSEGFPEGGSPRDFDGRIRNRLGGRLRGMEEQEDNYRRRGEQGWRDAGFSDVRLKRRRF